MATSLLSLDATVIEQANNIAEVDVNGRLFIFPFEIQSWFSSIDDIDYGIFFEWAFEILEGKNITDAVAEFSQQNNIQSNKINRIATALSAMLWYVLSTCSFNITNIHFNYSVLI